MHQTRLIKILCWGFLLLGNSGRAQYGGSNEQLEFKNRHSFVMTSYYIEAFYYNRYCINNDQLVTIHSTSLYKKNKVKKIQVYDPAGVLLYVFELDTAGVIVGGGYHNTYFTVWHRGFDDKGRGLYSQCYYHDSLLVRADTTFTTYLNYRNADTTMHFERSKTRVYKRGSLLNDQNTYYNNKFLNKPVALNPSQAMPYIWTSQPTSTIDERGNVVDKQPADIFLTGWLRNNYKPGILYYCGETYVECGFYALRGKDDISATLKPKHRFYRTYHPKTLKKTKVDGEDFEEPHQYVPVNFCGYGLHQSQLRQADANFTTRQPTLNSRGLYDTCYSLYYPLESTRESIEQYQQAQGRESPGAVRVTLASPYGGTRSKIPVKSLEYVIRYEYFE